LFVYICIVFLVYIIDLSVTN